MSDRAGALFMSPDPLGRPQPVDNSSSDRLIALLRERVSEKTASELWAYLEELLPPYEVPGKNSCIIDDRIDDRKLVYQTAEFLEHHDVQFVEVCYLCLLKRSADTEGLETSLRALRSEGYSRIQLLGRLRYSEEGSRIGVEVRGLRLRYFLARLRNIPALGWVAGLLIKFDRLLQMDLEVIQQNAELERGRRNSEDLKNRVSEHFGEVGGKLGVPVEGFSSSAQRYLEPGSSSLTGKRSLAEILSYPTNEFVLLIYQTVFHRDPSENELATSLGLLRTGNKTRTALFGDLFRSPDASGKMSDTPGLRAAYVSERLLSIPVIGFILQLPRALRMFSRIDAVLEYQSAEIADRARELHETEIRMMEHYNNTLMQLQRELEEAVRDSAAKGQK